MLELKWFGIIDRAAQAAKPGLVAPAAFDLTELGQAQGWAATLQSELFRRFCLGAFQVLRVCSPNARIGRLILVTREQDCRDVMQRSDEFNTPFGPEMTEVGDGTAFLLGMDGPEHDRLNRMIRQVVLPGDWPRLAHMADRYAACLIEGSGGRIDVIHDLCTRVAAETCNDYFGLDLPDTGAFADWLTAISALLFADPFGKPTIRRVAMAAATRARAAADRAVRLAKSAPPPGRDALVDRLVALQRGGADLSDAAISATLVGLATGMVPTFTRAAGNILQELLRRPRALEQAIGVARARDRDRLGDILMEAARLYPALSPGQWRFAPKPAVIAAGTRRARQVRAGDILLVAVMSAMRDGRAFEDPNSFIPGRQTKLSMVFGHGPHSCLGQGVSMVLLKSVFGLLLRQDGLRTAPGSAGRMSFIGGFARRLDMLFDTPTPSGQSMAMICIPVHRGSDAAALKAAVAGHGNPAGPAARQSLDATGRVHFASMSVVEPPGAPAPSLLLELNLDGPQKEGLDLVAEHCRWMEPILRQAAGPTDLSLAQLLRRHALDLAARPWGATGLNFNGTPEFSVADIARQQALAAFCRDALSAFLMDQHGIGARPMQAVDFVRRLIRQDPAWRDFADGGQESDPPALAARRRRIASLLARGAAFGDFLIRPDGRRLAISAWVAPSRGQAAWRTLTAAENRPLLAIPAVIFLACLAAEMAAEPPARGAHPALAFAARLAFSVPDALLWTVATLAAVAAAFIAVLLRHEAHDQPDGRSASPAALAEIEARENHPGVAQNHITAVTPLKPGAFRRLTFAMALWGIKQLVLRLFRPGFVLDMGTIHYAKWFRLPGSGTMIFLSNYDGSWQSYLEDFIIKAHEGQSAAWSNGVGFPRTRLLVLEGAEDGDAFKRWVRRQQIPTQFWYCRFPDLTTTQIRNNALIHDGLMRATTSSAAWAWLESFGSMPRPDGVIETNEVQSVVFRSLGALKYAAFGAFTLPGNAAAGARWLARLLRDDIGGFGCLRFGDRPLSGQLDDDHTEIFLCLSATGLTKLGLKPDADGALAGFPAAFTTGMAARAKILGDTGAASPQTWRWSDRPGAAQAAVADAVLMVFAKNPDRCRQALAAHAAELEGGAMAVIAETSPAIGDVLGTEHFGFRDGISQPVIRGTQRFYKGAPARDIAEPGEFLLGYRNNQTYFPPSPTVEPYTDPHDRLPVIPADLPTGFPQFTAGNDAPRDFGRNGSFVAIRELRQLVNEFHDFTARKAADLQRYAQIEAAIGAPVTADWVAAKLVGRLQDGTPLVDPAPKRQAGGRPANDFDYGSVDPQGLQCPLGAHIRRANPRESLEPGDPQQQVITNRHRLLRRGRSYTRSHDDGTTEKGLIFVGICADLERQFEFLQQTWINSPNFHGLTGEPDPLVAATPPGQEKSFTVPTPAGPVMLTGMQDFVTAQGGGYFFLPSRSAIEYLIDLGRADAPAAGETVAAGAVASGIYQDA